MNKFHHVSVWMAGEYSHFFYPSREEAIKGIALMIIEDLDNNQEIVDEEQFLKKDAEEILREIMAQNYQKAIDLFESNLSSLLEVYYYVYEADLSQIHSDDMIASAAMNQILRLNK